MRIRTISSGDTEQPISLLVYPAVNSYTSTDTVENDTVWWLVPRTKHSLGSRAKISAKVWGNEKSMDRTTWVTWAKPPDKTGVWDIASKAVQVCLSNTEHYQPSKHSIFLNSSWKKVVWLHSPKSAIHRYILYTHYNPVCSLNKMNSSWKCHIRLFFFLPILTISLRWASVLDQY